VRRLAGIVFAAFLVIGACGSPSPPALLVIHYDAGSDARPDTGSGDAGPLDANDDASPYLGGPCVDDGQCNDGIACTYDSCDQSVSRCLNVPDDTQCQDGNYCDGMELCVPGHGCEPGAVVSCDNGNECETADCVEATQSCQYTPRDVDQDGDPDAHCFPHRDCNDLNPDVSSLHAEVCANGVDDNCNGLVDEHPCVVPSGNSCESAIAVGGAGSYTVSTIGCNDTFATSCSVGNPAAAQTVVLAIPVPSGQSVDLEVWVTASVEVAVAIDGTCGSAASELACGAGSGATSVRARAYEVGAGTYYAVVTTQSPSSNVVVQVELLPPTPPATNVDCASATPLTPGTPVTASIVDGLPTNLPTACMISTGELTYSLLLAQAQDVRVYASTIQGSGSPVIGLRDPQCTTLADELSCEQAGTVALYEEDLQPGNYVITLAATSPIDATLDVELEPPTMPAQNQTCVAPPSVAYDSTTNFDLSNHENAIKDGCVPSGPDAAYDLSLASASDVLLIERIPESESGGVSLDTPACTTASEQLCETGDTPIRVGRRNVLAGDYRVVVADQLGLQGTLDTLVRNTVPPTIVPSGGAGSCAQAVDATSGGFFTGDTSTVQQTTSSACDSPGAPAPGERAQFLSLNLAQPQRVVLDMEGSAYETILDVRQGPSCPGLANDADCYVGFSAQRSFLDLELTAGQYFVIVSGYSGADGVWDLDVRVLPP
jgi:hypothetical protein